jgi:hypothetical protein
MSGLISNSRKGFLLGVVTADSFAKSSLDKLGYTDDVAPVTLMIWMIFKIICLVILKFMIPSVSLALVA